MLLLLLVHHATLALVHHATLAASCYALHYIIFDISVIGWITVSSTGAELRHVH